MNAEATTDSGRQLEDLKFTVATRMLDHIGLSMYGSYPKAIAELVVNGYDADATLVSVDIRPGEDRIVIADNGEGMDEQRVRDGYMFLGSGQKRLVQRTPIHGRLPIGNKGIGKLAGFGIARRIEVATTRGGKRLEFGLDRRALEGSGDGVGRMKEAVLDSAKIGLREKDAASEPNGTVITLRGLRSECGRVDVDKVVEHLAHRIPLGSTFSVVVNGRRCERTQIPASRRVAIIQVHSLLGRIVGEVIVAKKMLPQPGIITTVRGRAVGDPSLFDLKPTSFTYHVGDLIAGEIEVTSFDPEDGSEASPVIRTDRDGFVETHPKYIAYREFMTQVLADICRAEEKKRQEKKEAEKRAEVTKAIKTVADDFNAYAKQSQGSARRGAGVVGEEDLGGAKTLAVDIEVETKHRLHRHRKHRPIEPDVMREISASLGVGRLRFRGHSYDIKLHPLGSDFPECDIKATESLVLVNLDHVAYEQAVADRCVDTVMFRAIAGRFASLETETSEEMYEKLEEMVKFQAERARRRRNEAGEQPVLGVQGEIVLEP